MKNIFVGNLSFGATEDAVRSMFEAYGAVDRVSIVTDRETGQPRGFGFVEMQRADAARAIQSLNGHDMGGRSLKVNECKRMFMSVMQPFGFGKLYGLQNLSS